MVGAFDKQIPVADTSHWDAFWKDDFWLPSPGRLFNLIVSTFYLKAFP